MARKRILVIEDDDDARTMYGILLRGWGYEVLEVPTGREGVELARREVPDLILLDIMIPDMDGYEVCRQLRSDPAFHRVPILFLTALDSIDARIRGYTMGGDDFITKGQVDHKEIGVRIKAALDRSERLRAAMEYQGRGVIIGMMSFRGGVGVSTLAMNLARYATAADDRPVIFIDLSLPVGSISLWSGIVGPRHTIGLLSRPPADIDISLINNYSQQSVFGYYLIPGPATVTDLGGVRIQSLERVLTILRQEGYIVILDLGRGTLPLVWHTPAQCQAIGIITSADPTARALARIALDSLPHQGINRRALLLIFNDVTEQRPVDISLGLPRPPDLFIPYTKDFEDMADPAPFEQLWTTITTVT